MASFYNPYFKKPDYAQGMNEMMNQLMMMYLIGMWPSHKKITTGTTPLSKPGAGQISPGMGDVLMQNLPTQMQSMNPNMITQLLQGLQGTGGLGGLF